MVLNIVGLQISVPEFIWTIINFFLLVFLLKTFLYNPVLKFMDKRKADIDKGIAEGKQAELALAENNERLNAEIAESGAKARELITEARGEAEKVKGEALNEAHAKAADIRKEVYSRVGDEEASARADIENDMPELVCILTKRLLHDDAGVTDTEAVKKLVAAAKE